MGLEWSTRPSSESDAGWMAELRARVMRPDLERLGLWDTGRVRTRFLDAFDPAHTVVIQINGEDVGLIAVRPEVDSQWVEHFYLEPEYQGRGIGGGVLREAMDQHRDHRPFRLNVLQASPARALYERHGFVFDHEDLVDVFLVTNGS